VDDKTKHEQAKSYYEQCLREMKSKPEPKGQKFKCGQRVRIADDLGEQMSHFESGVNATVEYTYAHIYGGGDIKSYRLFVDGEGSVAWYYEHQLTALD
jgi:hypothetical protein